MEEISTETKLRLIRQIRAKYQQDQYDLSRRESLLYGYYNTAPGRETIDYSKNPPTSFCSIKNPRVWLAGGLLIAILLCDMLQVRPLGIDTRQIFTMVAKDYREDVDTFLEHYVASIDWQAP